MGASPFGPRCSRSVHAHPLFLDRPPHVSEFRPLVSSSDIAPDPGWLVSDSGRITGNSDRTAATFSQSLIGGMEAIDHEVETLLTKKTHHHKVCPAPARPRARQSRSLE